MTIFKKAEQLGIFLFKQQKAGKKTGFVPTMGALHDGHLTLIRESQKNTDLTVCSVFVNPTQFNNPDDFAKYPITIENDIKQLEMNGCDILFLPSVSEIYPSFYQKKHYDLGRIETLWEGMYRPGHFQGVCQVVDRLLEIVQPDHLFMGQKDFQQCMIVQKLLELNEQSTQVNLHIVPTVREQEGLAMSSRNLRLSSEEKQKAQAIYQSLSFIKSNLYQYSFDFLETEATHQLQSTGFSIDYLSIVNRNTLEKADTISEPLVVLAAATINNIRLIDNLILN